MSPGFGAMQLALGAEVTMVRAGVVRLPSECGKGEATHPA